MNQSSEFSRFIREASSREKKRVYRKVIEDSMAAQRAVTSVPLKK